MPTKTLNTKDIKKILPHRGIAMTLHSATYDPNKPDEIEVRISPRKSFMYFSGHYPARISVPGYWIIETIILAIIKLFFPKKIIRCPKNMVFPGHWQGECVCLAGALLAKIKYPETKGLPHLREFSTKCKRPITPNDDFIIRARIIERITAHKQDIFSISGDLMLGSKVASTTTARGILI